MYLARVPSPFARESVHEQTSPGRPSCLDWRRVGLSLRRACSGERPAERVDSDCRQRPCASYRGLFALGGVGMRAACTRTPQPQKAARSRRLLSAPCAAAVARGGLMLIFARGGLIFARCRVYIRPAPSRRRSALCCVLGAPLLHRLPAIGQLSPKTDDKNTCHRSVFIFSRLT